LATETEIRRQLRQTDQNLFDTFKALQATGLANPRDRAVIGLEFAAVKQVGDIEPLTASG